MAEHSRVIEPMTVNVLDKTLGQCRKWLDHGIEIKTSVNLSARVLHRQDIVDRIIALVDRHCVPMEYLCLEVTETAIMKSPETAREILEALSGCSVRISIDDFGTGYSSLKYLQQFPIDEIKIDRDFIVDLKRGSADDKIVKSVTALGKSLEMTVVAEGVENERAWEILVASGCDIAQGFFIGKPQPAESFEKWRLAWEASRKFPEQPTTARVLTG